MATVVVVLEEVFVEAALVLVVGRVAVVVAATVTFVGSFVGFGIRRD